MNQNHLKKYTKFEYLYRDADNYKVYSFLYLDGYVSEQNIGNYVRNLEGNRYFIAEQVGIPPLYQKLYELNGGPSDSDQCWHEFVAFQIADAPDETRCVWGTVAEFFERFSQIDSWNLSLSPHFEF